MPENLLEVQNLKTYFFTSEGTIKAVDDVSFQIKEGELVCLVGESGCGKSVTALSIIRLVPPPGKIVNGRIIFKGENLVEATEERMREIRGNSIAMIFQDPMTSLNPVYTVGEQIAEALRLHRKMSRREAREAAIEAMREVAIPDPSKRAKDYPHQLSGGMRQRIMIAMALACDPDLLIADEPTTALDVTIQAQILDLLNELRRRRKLSILLITHDLGVVAEVADRVCVMYTGKIVEEAEVSEIFESPKHPYTQGLISSVPRLSESAQKRLQTIEGNVPNLLNLPSGCHFAPRCKFKQKECETSQINLKKLNGSKVRCILY
ncbi:MAG: ABC transporter ATP-binding protein [Pyrinomonadaceae bacterium]|nr:ABC transporter ATP-binding protein [Pyrinomonadaceae bacterium]MCX7640293.1 ABC transporter ATP-binding protein [Pyrinomonadaceae bacterium]MDW8305259.1 ABC transporter ATP-binding protein [Acidobacteriota bacterium]